MTNSGNHKSANYCSVAPSGARRAFTLLEVLLASVLSATLLLTLWSLMGTFTSLFSTGGAKTEQSQIARSLLQQMCDDIGSAIADTAVQSSLQGTQTLARQENTQENTVRRFGLFGTRHGLRIDVLQIVPLEVSLAAYRSDDDRGPQSLAADEPRRRAPELRTVCYTFNERREKSELESGVLEIVDDKAGEKMNETLLGLVREEMDFETRNHFAVRSLDGEETESDIGVRIDSGSVLWVPEVVGMEFRYFDGSGWTSQWDSIKRKSLPVAVEIRLNIESLDPRAVRRRAVAEADGERLEDEQEASQSPDVETESSDYESYRLVVELPSANLHKGHSKPAAQVHATFGQPQPLSSQRLEPSTLSSPQSPLSSKPPKDTKASEQWLRARQK